MPENSPIFEEQTLTSDMSNFLEEWGLPLEGDIQESFKPDPSIEANRQELEAVRGQEIFDKLPESMKVDPPTQEMLDAQRGQASFDQSPESEKIDSPTNMQHIVEQGDTLSQIAQGLGVDMNQLAELNQIQDPNKIQVGQILNLVGLGDQQQPIEQQPIVAPTPPVSESTVEHQESHIPTSVRWWFEHLFKDKSNEEGAVIRTEASLKRKEYGRLKNISINTVIQRGLGQLENDDNFVKWKAREEEAGRPLYINDFVLIYDDYDESGRSDVGYNTGTTLEQLGDPSFNLKQSMGTLRLFTHKGKVYAGDEQNFPSREGEEPLGKQDLINRLIEIVKTGVGTGLDIKGIGHRIAEAFGPDMGDGMSARILIGGKKELGLSANDFKKIPTLEQYEKFMIQTGQLSEGHPSITWGRKKAKG